MILDWVVPAENDQEHKSRNDHPDERETQDREVIQLEKGLRRGSG